MWGFGYFLCCWGLYIVVLDFGGGHPRGVFGSSTKGIVIFIFIL